MKLLLTFLVLISIKVYSQELPNFKVPTGYHLVDQAEGDLDKDGIKEVVYAYNTTHNNGENGFDRELYICKRIAGKLKLWKKNTTVLWKSKDCGFYANDSVPFEMSIRNNTLIISQTFYHNSRHTSTYNSIFRYQNKDWYLIGSTYSDADNCDYDFTYDINFSINKVDISETYGSCDGDDKPVPKDEFFTFRYIFKNIPKMDTFTPGKMVVKIPNSKKSFYY